MKPGTKIQGQLIVDGRFTKNTDLETAISVKRSSLTTAIYDEGIELYEFGKERLLNEWSDGSEPQIRQTFTLILSKTKSKNEIYKVVNSVQAQPLKFL